MFMLLHFTTSVNFLIEPTVLRIEKNTFDMPTTTEILSFLFFSPGPNSPLSWMKKCVENLVPNPNSPNRKKILLGLNFYGNDYTPGGGGPIVSHQ